MMYVTNIYTLPVLILIWILDAWIGLTVIRWIIEKGLSTQNPNPWQTLQNFTDSLPRYVIRFCHIFFNYTIPPWIAWLICVLGVIMMKNWLCSILMSSQPQL